MVTEEEEDAAAVDQVSSTITGDLIFANNFAMGGLVGLWMIPWDNTCTELKHFTTAKNIAEGVVMVNDAAECIISKIVISDSKNGLFVATGTKSFPLMKLTHSSILGLGLLEVCPECYEHNEKECNKNGGFTLGMSM